MPLREAPPSTAEAAAWLARALDGPAALSALARTERPELQIAIVRAAVEQMPELRRSRDYARGARLYELATTLYGAKLPWRDADIADLLRSARHDCGHGADVSAPIDLAIRHARKHGLTDELAAAVQSYMAELTGLSTATASATKRKAAFLLVLAGDDQSRSGKAKPCWSRHIRAAIGALPPKEALAWADALLHMPVNDRAEMPAGWTRRASSFVRDLGADRVLALLESCWPGADGSTRVVVQTAGTHLLKGFVSLLELAAEASPAESGRADDLVGRLSVLDYEPRERAAKVVLAAALYFSRRPHAREASAAMARLGVWARAGSPSDGAARRAVELIAAFEGRPAT